MPIKATTVFHPNGRYDWSSPKIFLFGNPYNMADSPTFGSLGPLLKRYGIKKLYAPDPSQCNAMIAQKEQLRVSEHETFLCHGNFMADGIVLEKAGDGAIILSADCPTAVIWNPRSNPKKRKVVVAHCGRDSLLDIQIFQGLPKSREHESVVQSVLAQFSEKEYQHLSVYTTLGIGPRSFKHLFSHPKFGKQNEAMVQYVLEKFGPRCFVDLKAGALDLHALIRAQFEKGGVLFDNIRRDQHDTYADRAFGRCYKWHSHRRNQERGLLRSRNAVLVLHSLDQSKK